MAGGGTRLRFSLGLAVCAGGIAVLGSQALAAPPISASVNGKPVPVIFKKGKIRSDGALAVGQPETITVKNLPPRLKFQLYIEPSPQVPECQNFNLECEPQPVYPIAATPPFRTQRKGRAVVSFVMPPAYEIFDYVDPTQSHPVKFINGQAVHIRLEGDSFQKRHGQPIFIAGEATGRAAAQVPPTP
jgi:hypothetical protein